MGKIRSGRNEGQKAAIGAGLSRALAARAGVAPESITVTCTDIEASYTMEGGALLPEPGSAEEEAWKALG